MLLKRASLSLLTLLLLFADSGQMIYAHTCFKSKHTHYSFSAPKHCCGGEKETKECSVTKSHCCEITSKYLKQNFVQQHSSVDNVYVCAPTAYVLHRSPFIIYHSPLLTLSSSFLPDKSSLVFTQSFRI